VNKNLKRFTKFKLHDRGFAHLFLVVMVVILAFGGLFYFSWQKGVIKTTPSNEVSPTPTANTDETVNWKTYKNKKYNYQVSYHSDWYVLYSDTEDLDTARDISFRKFKDLPFYAEGQIEFTIIVHPNPNNLTLSEFLIRGDINIFHPELSEFITLEGEQEDRRKTVEKMEKTTFNGFEALRYKELENEIKLFVNNNNIFLFYLNVSDNNASVNPEELFNQILSTFQFTE